MIVLKFIEKIIQMNRFFFVLMSFFLFLSCTDKKDKEFEISSDDYHLIMGKLEKVIVYDVFSPPVASRVYAYPNIAAHEVLASGTGKLQSLSGRLTGLNVKSYKVKENVNFKLASMIAFMDVAKELIFSKDKYLVLKDSLYNVWGGENEKVFKASKGYGKYYAKQIVEWLEQDNYNQTRTLPEYDLNTDEEWRWKPTPPAYMNGIEPNWNKIRPFVIDSSAQFKPVKHPDFSLDKNSKFYKELIEVYNVKKEISEKGDASEEMAIARFWDCNPYVSVNKGHFMFAEKKITPGGHWMGICKIACIDSQADFEKTVQAYAYTSIVIADAFISCWDEKYRSNLVRPETLINKYIDSSWEPVLQTPPFPEYTSGHSVVSGAASVVLTSLFGDDFSFNDTTELPYGLPVRSFLSFSQAADEAAISRLYGGIHYRAAIDNGLLQGRRVGGFFKNKIIKQ